jgi:hypothetical protein
MPMFQPTQDIGVLFYSLSSRWALLLGRADSSGESVSMIVHSTGHGILAKAHQSQYKQTT